MTMTWRPRDSRGHYLPDSEPTYSLDPYDWDDTCRHQPTELKPSAETFGHEPITDDREFFGEISDDPPVCARCTRTIRGMFPVVIGQEPSGRVITREQRTSFEVAVLWPCTSAVVLGLVDRSTA